jgi:hypothetical protein
MATAGKDSLTDGALWSASFADNKMFCIVTMPEAGTVNSVWAYIRNQATGHAACDCLGVFYNTGTSGSLLGSSAGVAVTDNQAAGWVQFTLGTPAAVSAGNFYAGILPSATGNGLELYGTNTGYGAFTGWNTDYYSGGAAATVGAYSSDDSLQCVYVEYTTGGASFTNPAFVQRRESDQWVYRPLMLRSGGAWVPAPTYVQHT